MLCSRLIFLHGDIGRLESPVIQTGYSFDPELVALSCCPRASLIQIKVNSTFCGLRREASRRVVDRQKRGRTHER